MNVWFDLIANPNSKLGILEKNGNRNVTPELAERVITYIASKYDPEVVYFV